MPTMLSLLRSTRAPSPLFSRPAAAQAEAADAEVARDRAVAAEEAEAGARLKLEHTERALAEKTEELKECQQGPSAI